MSWKVTQNSQFHFMQLNITHAFYQTQIADFGMARDVADDNYYVTTGGKIPVRWTSPEVHIYIATYDGYVLQTHHIRTIGNILQEILCAK